MFLIKKKGTKLNEIPESFSEYLKDNKILKKLNISTNLISKKEMEAKVIKNLKNNQIEEIHFLCKYKFLFFKTKFR